MVPLGNRWWTLWWNPKPMWRWVSIHVYTDWWYTDWWYTNRWYIDLIMINVHSINIGTCIHRMHDDTEKVINAYLHRLMIYEHSIHTWIQKVMIHEHSICTCICRLMIHVPILCTLTIFFHAEVFYIVHLMCFMFQMILKFFDIFLKMKDLTSSEAFLVIQLIHVCIIQRT